MSNSIISKYQTHFSKMLWLFGQSRGSLYLLTLCFVITGLIDLIGIGLIGPYIALFVDFERTQDSLSFLRNFSYEEVAIYSSLILVSVFIFRIFIALLVNNFVLKVAFNKQIELRAKLTQAIHDQSYADRLTKTTGHYTQAIISFCTEYTNSTISVLRTCAELISVIFLTALLILTDWRLFLLTLSIAGMILFISIYFFSQKFSAYGEIKIEGIIMFFDALNDSVTGVKEIKVLKISDFFKTKVIEGATVLATAEKKLYLYTIIPRYFIECVLVIIISSLLIFSVLTNQDILNTISVLTIFLVAAVRLLPAMNSIFQNFNIINLEMDSVRKLYEELKQYDTFFDPSANKNTEIKIPSHDFSNFTSVTFEQLFFSYGNNEVIRDLNFEINKGDFIGLLGKSGEGKTTLVDLMLGIHKPLNGDILSNGVSIFKDIDSWRDNLAYLPQETFLINTSIAENIAIGENITKEVENKIKDAISKAGLADVVANLQDNIYTKIGERGLLLSGGQRQRISLARAFYKNRKIFIFDESTSALDEESAQRVLDHIVNMSKSGATIILISHNESNLNQCNRKIKLINGKLEEIIE
jgi:ABC-type multidrug transport system fused ATPase/permease subunit